MEYSKLSFGQSCWYTCGTMPRGGGDPLQIDKMGITKKITTDKNIDKIIILSLFMSWLSGPV